MIHEDSIDRTRTLDLGYLGKRKKVRSQTLSDMSMREVSDT